MRRAAGLMFAMALLIPAGVSAAPAAGAAGASCTKITGTATFSPALPVTTSKLTVKPTITTSSTISGCTGGGVKSGTTTQKTKSTVGLNCANVATAIAKSPPSTETEIWNTKAKSTVLVSLSAVKGSTTESKLTSKVTAGLFKGTTTTATLELTGALPKKGACSTAALNAILFGSVGKIVTTS
ncbi:MAG: hypothetical protein ACLPVY_21195 [Acidimicrobiia bacterium]